MTRAFHRLAAAVLCAAIAFPAAARADEAAVRAAADGFYAALNTMFTGDLGPMIEVWSHTSDVTYMGPAGGLRVGWEQIRPDWQVQADRKLGGEVEARDMHITVGADIALVVNYEVGRNVVDGKVQEVTIRATNTFRKEDGAWKMIGHHTDILPFLMK